MPQAWQCAQVFRSSRCRLAGVCEQSLSFTACEGHKGEPAFCDALLFDGDEAMIELWKQT